MQSLSRRSFTLLGASLLMGAASRPGRSAAKPIRVLIWDERQPAQKQAYENFLGNAIADHLRSVANSGPRPLEVKSVCLDDPEQGLAAETLDNTDVLVWWGHQRHNDLKPERAKDIVRRIKEGRLQLLSLHSAHWSQPFIEAMKERTLQDAMASLTPEERKNVEVKTIPAEMRLYRKDEPLTPSFKKSTKPDGGTLLEVKLPSCVFTMVEASGKPSHLTTLVKHPITEGVPTNWDIPQTEIYGGPFHVPTPDVTLFNEKWDNGETFPAGCVWSLGKGKVVYFRPGHEIYPIFKQEVPIRVVENAVRWLGKEKK